MTLGSQAKSAGYSCQDELAVALREAGRAERGLSIINRLLDAGIEGQANTGLDKGET